MTDFLEHLYKQAMNCCQCKLSLGRTNVVFSDGNPITKLMFIGEAPGRDEDLQGLPFVGKSGKLLDRLIYEEMGLSRNDFYIANVVKCRPPNNRDPEPDEVNSCSQYLSGQLEYVNPKVIVTLGNFAARSILKTKEGITRLRGKTYNLSERVVVPTFHPAAALRNGGQVLAQMRADLVLAKKVLANA
jgi:uracil-DNA glycosylase family 4